MQITDEQVEKYKAIRFEETGESVDSATGREELTALVGFMDVVFQFWEYEAAQEARSMDSHQIL